MSFLVVAAVGAWWWGLSRLDRGRPRSGGTALTAPTTTLTTIGGEEGRHVRLSRHAVVVVWPGDSGVVEVAVDGVIDSVGDDVPTGLDPFEPGESSRV